MTMLDTRNDDADEENVSLISLVAKDYYRTMTYEFPSLQRTIAR